MLIYMEVYKEKESRGNCENKGESYEEEELA